MFGSSIAFLISFLSCVFILFALIIGFRRFLIILKFSWLIEISVKSFGDFRTDFILFTLFDEGSILLLELKFLFSNISLFFGMLREEILYCESSIV